MYENLKMDGEEIEENKDKRHDSKAQICLGTYIFPCIGGFVVMISMYKNDLKWPSWLSTLCKHI